MSGRLDFEADMYNYIKDRTERFGSKVVKTLYKNVQEKQKGKWDNISKEVLILKLTEEFSELINALKANNPEHITLESTDVSAVVMMISDNFGRK